MTNPNATLTAAPRDSHPTRTPKSQKRVLRQGGEGLALLLLVVVFSVINPDSFPTVVNLQTVLDQASTPSSSESGPRS